MKKKVSKPHPTPEEFGQMLVNIYESGYLDRNKAYKMSFVKGVAGGLGGVIGATIVVALLLWILSVLQFVPFVENIADNVQNTIENKPK